MISHGHVFTTAIQLNSAERSELGLPGKTIPAGTRVQILSDPPDGKTPGYLNRRIRILVENHQVEIDSTAVKYV